MAQESHWMSKAGSAEATGAGSRGLLQSSAQGSLHVGLHVGDRTGFALPRAERRAGLGLDLAGAA